MKVTLDTNCFFDYFERDPQHITRLIDHASLGHIELAMTTRVMADTLDKWKNPGVSPIWTKIQTFPLLKTIGTGFRLNYSCLNSGDFLISDEDVKDEARLRKIMPEAQLADIDHLFGHIAGKRDLFITSDPHFLDHAEELKGEFEVVVLKPENALQEIEKIFPRDQIT